MAKTSTKHKHLTLDERIEIKGCLDHCMTFKDTAKRVSKDQTTISKEVKKHLTIKEVTYKQTTEDGRPVETPQQYADYAAQVSRYLGRRK